MSKILQKTNLVIIYQKVQNLSNKKIVNYFAKKYNLAGIISNKRVFIRFIFS